MEKLKVVFIGGLTNGKIVYDYLLKNKYVDLCLTITYPDNIDKPRHVIFPDSSKVIKTLKANDSLSIIEKCNPDYIFVAGWSELLFDKLISCSTKGTIGFHPSKLPQDRGRSVLAWQIEDGYEESALTMFYYNSTPDGGDIVGQELISIENNDYVNDILNKVDGATINLMRAYFPLLRLGIAPRKMQNINEGNFRRLRTSRDSKINWNTNTNLIFNKIRAISTPYPGAEGVIENVRYKINEANPVDFSFGSDKAPGFMIAKLYDKSMIVRTKDGFIRITKFELITE